MTDNERLYIERLTRIETNLEHTMHQSEHNGRRSEEILKEVLQKIDTLDTKIEARFNKIEEHALQDANELRALKNKGAGVLAALGVVFTVTATIFSEFFSYLNKIVFG